MKTDVFRVLAAKSDYDDGSKWLPLWMHCRDTAGVMSYLVRHWVPQSVILASGLDSDSFHRTAVFLAYVHDIGKASALFQSRITEKLPEIRNRIDDFGLTVLPVRSYIYPGKTPHAYAGKWILMEERYRIPEEITEIVGAHHGKPFEGQEIISSGNLLELYPENIYGSEVSGHEAVWRNIWDEIINEALTESTVNCPEDLPSPGIKGQVLLSGLLIMADWISSNSSYFPLINTDSIGYRDSYPDRIQNGLTKLKFGEPWEPGLNQMTEAVFRDKFGFVPNVIQKEMLDVINHASAPGIYILEAQMGCGKTEAALGAADVLASRFGQDGIYFGLPSQATSNGIFPRIIQWAERESEDSAHAVRLAHGASQLNEEYNDLLFYGHSLVSDTDDDITGAYAHPWFEGRKKALLADFVVGTVDQFLMCALKRKHFMLRHLGLAGKVVIIDEVHSYDVYMNQFLKRAVIWMAAYGVPVILLSATLPSDRRKDLAEAYANASAKYYSGKKKRDKTKDAFKWQSELSYPLLTWTDGDVVRQKVLKQKPGKKEVRIRKLTGLQTLGKTLLEKLQDGGCAAIIANTVKNAQKITDTFQCMPGFKDFRIILYHAQFTSEDRIKKEKELLEHMGKHSAFRDRDRVVLIGTQVLEQSLDYDADIMAVELCPMDLLLQRIGRLHRHSRDDRPIGVREAECLLFDYETLEEQAGREHIYGKLLLMRTEKLLPENILLPDDISFLVQKTYDFKDTLGLREEYGESFELAVREHDDRIRDKKEKAKEYLMKDPSRQMIGEILKKENASPEQVVEAQVRDVDLSLEVLLMVENDSGYASFLPGHHDGIKIAMDKVPTNTEGRLIAREKIRLPHTMAMPYTIGNTIKELEQMNIRKISLWQKSSWLKGELVLFLGGDFSGTLGPWKIHYSYEKGLQYDREKTNS